MDTDSDAHSYPKELKNTVNRLNKRGEIIQLWTCSTIRIRMQPCHALNTLFDEAVYDYGTVHGIVNTASVVHVSFLPPSPSGTYDDPQERMPIILPMIGKIGVYPEGSDDTPACYLHGKSAMHPSACWKTCIF